MYDDKETDNNGNYNEGCVAIIALGVAFGSLLLLYAIFAI